MDFQSAIALRSVNAALLRRLSNDYLFWTLSQGHEEPTQVKQEELPQPELPHQVPKRSQQVSRISLCQGNGHKACLTLGPLARNTERGISSGVRSMMHVASLSCQWFYESRVLRNTP